MHAGIDDRIAKENMHGCHKVELIYHIVTATETRPHSGHVADRPTNETSEKNHATLDILLNKGAQSFWVYLRRRPRMIWG